MKTNINNWNAKAKEIQATYKLRHTPDVLSDRTAAFRWTEGMNKLHLVILGDDQKFWVVCPADASRLIKAGYEYAL